MRIGAIVVDCAPGMAGELADFYARLLACRVSHPAENGMAAIEDMDGPVLAFQEVSGYQQPTWPPRAGQTGQMLHFDLWVRDVPAAVNHALQCGARLAAAQYFADSRTLLDPAGHPFCIDPYPQMQA